MEFQVWGCEVRSMNPSSFCGHIQPGTSGLEYVLFPWFIPLPKNNGYCRDCIGSSSALAMLWISRFFLDSLISVTTFQRKIFLENLFSWILAELSPAAKLVWILLLHLTEEKERAISVVRHLQSEICLGQLQNFSPIFTIKWTINHQGKVEFTV